MQNLTIQNLNSQNSRNIHGFCWKRLYIRGKWVFSTYTQHTQTYTIRASTYTQHTREIHIRVIVPNMGIVSSQRGNKKKLGYLLIETRPLSHSKQATYSEILERIFEFERNKLLVKCLFTHGCLNNNYHLSCNNSSACMLRVC